METQIHLISHLLLHYMTKTALKIVASTDLGLVRTNNEDNFIVCPDLKKGEWLIPQSDDYLDLGEYGALLVVADGMGGANAGEVASEIAVETIKETCSPEQLEKLVFDDNNIPAYLEDAISKANACIRTRSEQDETTSGMGTTIVMAWVYGGFAYITWCGDSRCYVYNSKVGLQRLSKDHSYVQELVDKGDLDPEAAFSHPYSNVITKCLDGATKHAVPESRKYEIQDGDILLLCTDGLSGLCRDDEIIKVISENEDLQACKNALIKAALNNGGHDNVTVAMAALKNQTDEDDKPLLRGTVDLKKKKRKKNTHFWIYFILLVFAALCIAAYIYLDFNAILTFLSNHLKK